MRFKDFIKESIIDIPRQRYAPGVFDDADTNNPKLKPVVVNLSKIKLKNLRSIPSKKIFIDWFYTYKKI